MRHGGLFPVSGPRGGGGLAEDTTVRAMGLVRLLSAAIELTAAALILRAVTVEKAMRINALLGLVGPAIFIAVSTLGLIGLSDRITFSRAAVIICGIALVLAGTRG